MDGVLLDRQTAKYTAYDNLYFPVQLCAFIGLAVAI